MSLFCPPGAPSCTRGEIGGAQGRDRRNSENGQKAQEGGAMLTTPPAGYGPPDEGPGFAVAPAVAPTSRVHCEG